MRRSQVLVQANAILDPESTVTIEDQLRRR